LLNDLILTGPLEIDSQFCPRASVSKKEPPYPKASSVVKSFGIHNAPHGLWPTCSFNYVMFNSFNF